MARKPDLHYYKSPDNKIIFVRLPEDDNDDESRVSLYRLLETHNINVDHAMAKWKRIRAMKLPIHIYPHLVKYYTMILLTDREWFSAV